MGKAIRVEIEGMADVRQRLDQLGLSFQDIPTMPEISRRYAEVTAGLAPKRTGTLANKIKPVKSKKNQAGARASTPYAATINYGWPARNIRAQHFMNRADAVLAQELITLMHKGIDQLIEKQRLEP